MNPEDLLPLDRFLPKPKVPGQKRTGGSTPGSGFRGRGQSSGGFRGRGQSSGGFRGGNRGFGGRGNFRGNRGS